MDFHAVSGYDESLPIMEDVQLCISMHEAGPATMPIGGRGPARGRVRQVMFLKSFRFCCLGVHTARGWA